MVRYVYLDVFLLTNLLINLTLLLSTAWFIRAPFKTWRLILASFMGALYALFFFSREPILYSWAGKLVFTIGMLATAFLPNHWLIFLRVIAFFFGFSFLVAGASVAFSMLTSNDPVSVGPLISSGTQFAAMFAALAIGKFSWRYVQKINRLSSVFLQAEIKLGEQKARVVALLDTGNQLRDPVTGVPVMVVEYNAIRSVLPQNLRDLLDGEEGAKPGLSSPGSRLSSFGEFPFQTRLRLIPFTALGRDGVLIGFKPDRVSVLGYVHPITTEKVIVGIYLRSLSQDGRYRALLNPELLESA